MEEDARHERRAAPRPTSPARRLHARAPKRYVIQSATPAVSIAGMRNAVLASFTRCHFSWSSPPRDAEERLHEHGVLVVVAEGAVDGALLQRRVAVVEQRAPPADVVGRRRGNTCPRRAGSRASGPSRAATRSTRGPARRRSRDRASRCAPANGRASGGCGGCGTSSRVRLEAVHDAALRSGTRCRRPGRPAGPVRPCSPAPRVTSCRTRRASSRRRRGERRCPTTASPTWNVIVTGAPRLSRSAST